MQKIINFSICDKTSLKVINNSKFLILMTKLAFFRFKQTFIKTSILYHFNLKYYIQNETNASGYVIGYIFSQLIPKSGKWHLVAFFSKKIIPREI